jgi:hypothetical protein
MTLLAEYSLGWPEAAIWIAAIIVGGFLLWKLND